MFVECSPGLEICVLWRFYDVDWKLYHKIKNALQRIFKASCEDCPKGKKITALLDGYTHICYNVYNERRGRRPVPEIHL